MWYIWVLTAQNGQNPLKTSRRTPFSIDFWKSIAISNMKFPLKMVVFSISQGGTQGFFQNRAKNVKIDPFLTPKSLKSRYLRPFWWKIIQKVLKMIIFSGFGGPRDPLFYWASPLQTPVRGVLKMVIFDQKSWKIDQKSLKMCIFWPPIFLWNT